MIVQMMMFGLQTKEEMPPLELPVTDSLPLACGWD